jgi:hypothetical protein
MDTIDYWRLCDELSVVQAALLIVGQDPSDWQESVELNYTQSKPPGYDAARAALIHAIEGKRLRATIVYDDEAPVRNPIDDDPVPYCPEPHPSWHESRISVEDLQDWLISRGIRTGFFFQRPSLFLTICPGFTQTTPRNWQLRLRRGRPYPGTPNSGGESRSSRPCPSGCVNMRTSLALPKKTAIPMNRALRISQKLPTGTRRVEHQRRREMTNSPTPLSP